MSSKMFKKKIIILAAVAGILFCIGLTQLLFLRFKTGDVYPPYSSMRSDPLGTQVLFESLEQVEKKSSYRNFRSLDHIVLTPKTTLLICGITNGDDFLKNKTFGQLMNQLKRSGGRLVLTFSSRLKKSKRENGDDQAKKNPKDKAQKENKDPEALKPSSGQQKQTDGADESDGWLGAASLGIGFKHTPVLKKDDMIATRFFPQANGLPARIPWRANLIFDGMDQVWQTVYTWQGQPVIVQRSWGRGQLVLAADSYLLSNEAMRRHRITPLIVWLADLNSTVVFDEYHHGLTYRPGIAGLARQYRLHGVLGAILVVVVLLIWRQVAVFVPSIQNKGDSGNTASAIGRDTIEGLVDLTRQHINPERLLSICFETWEPLCAPRIPSSTVEAVRTLIHQAAADPKSHKPVDTYRQICQWLKQGKRDQ